MAYPTSPGTAAYSGNFIPEIWSGKLIENFYDATVLAAISNTDYEGEIKDKGDRVKMTHGSTPVTLYEGEVTNDVSHAVIEGGEAYYDVTCAGLWWKAGRRGEWLVTLPSLGWLLVFFLLPGPM